MLPGSFRRTETEGTAGESAVCHKEAPVVRRAVTGLDPLVTAEFYQLIEKINKEAKIAVVMVSHDIESTIQYASHILHLQESALFYGTAQEYQNSTVGKRFLGGEGNA